MKKLFAKMLLAGFPLIMIIALYVYTDPFKVIYHYDHFYDHTPRVGYLNRDYISTESFLKNNDKNKYNSFIFGSSRSGVYQVKEWEKHINSTACMHFDGYCETLFGIERKFEFLDKRGVKIKNALIILDHELLAVTANTPEPIYRKHPLISGESNFDFQLTMFKYFLDVDFIPAYLRLLLNTRPAQSKDNSLYSDSTSLYEAAANEEHRWSENEAFAAQYPDSFYKQRSDAFYKRDTTVQYASHVIKDEQLKMLTTVKKILSADATDYRIVINPLYNQKRMDTTDLRILQTMFGKDKVYNFSGINEITQSKGNYLEAEHYRISTATRIMDIIYKKN